MKFFPVFDRQLWRDRRTRRCHGKPHWMPTTDGFCTLYQHRALRRTKIWQEKMLAVRSPRYRGEGFWRR